MELSFLTADHYLGIPPLLDMEEMLLYDYPDQFSIMTYVAQFHQVFFRPYSGYHGFIYYYADININVNVVSRSCY